MAHLDPSRTALELDESELAAAGALLLAPDADFLSEPEVLAVIDKLETAGVVANRELQGYSARIVAVLAEPEFRVMVERFTTDYVSREFAAVRGEFGVWGVPTRDGNEFTPIEPSLIAWACSRAVGLGPRAESKLSESVELRASVLQQLIDNLNELDIDANDALLDTEGMSSASRIVITKLLINRRSSWRVSSVWQNELGDYYSTSMAAIDGGDSGFWFSDHFETDSDDPHVRITPTQSGAIWERLVQVVQWPREVISDHAS